MSLALASDQTELKPKLWPFKTLALYNSVTLWMMDDADNTYPVIWLWGKNEQATCLLTQWLVQSKRSEVSNILVHYYYNRNTNAATMH